MTRTLANETERDRLVQHLVDASQGRTQLQAGLSLTVPDEGLDLTDRFEKGEWGQTEIPITLDATVRGYLPRRLAGAPVHLKATVANVELTQLVAQKSALGPSDDAYSTKLLASSAGSLLLSEDAIKLGTFTEYKGLRPSRIAWDVVRRAPYSRDRVRIAEVPGVALDYKGSGESPGFLAHEPIGAPLARMGADQSVDYRYRDTADNGFVAWIRPPLSRGDGGEPEGTWRYYRSTDFPDWDKQRPQPPIARYSAVRVYHLGEDGRLLWEQVADVPYPYGHRIPHRGRTLDIPYEDPYERGPKNGLQTAKRIASDLSRTDGQGPNLMLPVYDPLLEIDDPIWVTDAHPTDDGTYEVLWKLRVESYKHFYGTSPSGAAGAASLATDVSYTATVLSEELIRVPSFIGLLRHSPGIHQYVEPTSASFTQWGQTDIALDSITQTFQELT